MSQIRSVIFAITLLYFFISLTGAMQCQKTWNNNDDFLSTAINRRFASCPPILGDEELEYCCVNSDAEAYCCSLLAYMIYICMPLIPFIIILSIISSVVCGICCFFGLCCSVYKRRPGIVYRRTETTATSTSPPYQPVAQQFIAQPSVLPSFAAPKAHLPPGAYPVFPQFTG